MSVVSDYVPAGGNLLIAVAQGQDECGVIGNAPCMITRL